MARKKADTLKDDVRDAKAAAADSAKAILQDAEQFADPRTWTRSHPWLALTSALIAGFAAGAAFTPSSGKSEAKQTAEPTPPPPESPKAEPGPLNRIVELFWKEVLGLAGVLLRGLIQSYFQHRNESQDGHNGPPDGSRSSR